MFDELFIYSIKRYFTYVYGTIYDCVLLQPPPKVKSPTVGRGRGRGTGNQRGSGRGRGRKRVHHSEDNASDEEKYIPRSSKRRAAVAAVSRMKQPSDYEDDDFDDVLPARPIPVAKPVSKTGRPRGRPPRSAGSGRCRKPMQISDDNDSDVGQNNVDDYDSSEDSPVKKKHASDKAKPTCQYGKDCYRSVSDFLSVCLSCVYVALSDHKDNICDDHKYIWIKVTFSVSILL